MTRSPDQPNGSPVSLPPVAIVVSRYNPSVTDALLEGALSEYARRGGNPDTVEVIQAPGSFELPVLALAAAGTGRVRAVVALGCLIRGQTRHDRYIAQAVARGLTDVALKTGLPVTFGVLTVEKPSQARERAGGARGNKGADAMGAALDAVAAIERLAVPSRTAPRLAIASPDKAASGGDA